jgi:glutamine synthetase
MKAVDEYAEILRLSVASAGNDHRLGANEAPPAIVSMFVGKELQAIIDSIISGNTYVDNGRVKTNLGISSLPVITEDATDRNRTSPFAFTGNKFEFRMCGSSSNIAEPCFTLNTVVAQSLSEIADVLEKASDVKVAAMNVAKDIFTKHERIIFNGNNYSEEWVAEATKRGLPNIGNTVLAIKEIKAEKNKLVFEKMGVLSEKEIESRYEILLDNYSKTINVEALTLIDIVDRQLLPSILGYALKLSEIADKAGNSTAKKRLAKINALSDAIDTRLDTLKAALGEVVTDCAYQTALGYHEKIVSGMAEVRAAIDEIEPIMPAEVWPVPVYADLLFRV